jgi:cell division protein FtsB
MSKLVDVIAQERRLAQQHRQLQDLRRENEKLHGQLERMRTAMRRCLTCEYHPRNRTDDG